VDPDYRKHVEFVLRHLPPTVLVGLRTWRRKKIDPVPLVRSAIRTILVAEKQPFNFDDQANVFHTKRGRLLVTPSGTVVCWLDGVRTALQPEALSTALPVLFRPKKKED
jgi:hypothetical protein